MPEPGAVRRPHRPAVILAARGAALVALVLLAYVPALHGGFVWDDNDHVTENRALRTLDGLRRIWLELGAVPQYYPMVHTTFWIEYRLWGLDPTGYHVTNVLLHALAALLLWGLLAKLRVPGAWLAAALFGTHPVHVESVAWVSERKNVLSAVFYLVAAHVWLRARPLDGAPGRHPVLDYGLAVVLYLGALLSKTVTASLPAAMLLVTWWKRGRVALGDVLAALPLFACGVGAGFLTLWMERHHVGAAGRVFDLSLVERLLVAGRAVWFYAAKIVWPHPLVFVYPRFGLDPSDVGAWLLTLGAPLVPCALWALRHRIGRGPCVAALFFGGTLVPALGFFDVYPMRYSFVADHFQYLASLGVLVPLAAGAASGFTRLGQRGRKVALAAGAAVLAALAALGFRQSALYADPETLWRDTLQKNPSCFIAHNNLGAILLLRGDSAGARRHFEEAIRAEPRAPEAYDNLGTVLHNLARYDDAVLNYRKALEIAPAFSAAHNNLGITLAALGDTEGALASFRTAIRLRPSFARARYNLAIALLGLSRDDEAWAELSEAARLEPDEPRIHAALAEAARRRGRGAAARGGL